MDKTHLQRVNKSVGVFYRYKLFASENCLEHVRGAGEGFSPWNHNSFTQESTSKCTSYFVEPLPWMASVLLGRVEGKVST